MAKPSNLKDIRESGGLSLAQLSRYSNVSTTTIHHIENRKKSSTKVTKSKILKGLNKHPDNKKEYTYEEVFPNG